MPKVFKITESQLNVIKQEIVNEIFGRDKNNIIDESQGINDEVLRATQELYEKALEHQEELLAGKPVTFTLRINDYDGIQVYLNPSVNTDGGSHYRPDRKLSYISIDFKIMDGQIDWPSLMDTAQHEINHIFAQDVFRKNIYSQASLEAKAMIYDKKDNNRALGIIAYIADPFEQQSLINGMYAFIKQCKKDGKLPVPVSQIDAYQQLAKLYRAKNYLEKHQSDTEMLQDMHPKDRIGFGWSCHKFRERAIKGIKNLEFRIQRTIKKCKQDGLSVNGEVVTGEEEWMSDINNDNSCDNL